MSADPLDAASEAADFLLSATLSNRVVYAGVSEEFCLDCGEDIPQERRDAVPGCKRCIFCQEKSERRAG